MFDKYEIKTYPEYYEQENTETDSENEIRNMPFKKTTYINEKIYPNENMDKCIFTKENDNIGFYQSDANNKIKEKKSKNKKIQRYIVPSITTYYDSDIIHHKNTSPSMLNKKKYTHKLQKMEESKENSIKRINLNKYFNLNEPKIQKRSVKTYKNQLDVEKSDNFKVLSYKQEDYISDYPKQEKKNKIIQLFKKQEASELFLPSKRAISPPSPPISNTGSGKKEKEKTRDKSLSYYQTPTLKFQSFFGSFMRPKLKKHNKTKSTSKNKINQLKDFNIDKLIEIGDNTENKFKNILSFGKNLMNIKNQSKIKQLKTNMNPINFGEYEKCVTENGYSINEGKKYMPIQRIELDRKDCNDVKAKKEGNKKIFYHCQIKRKRNIKKNKTSNSMNNQVQINDNIDAQNYSLNNYLNNTTNIIINNNSSKIKKKIMKSNPKLNGTDFFYQSQPNQNNNKQINSNNNDNNYKKINKRNNNNSLINQISPTKSLPNNKINYTDVNKKNINNAKTNTSNNKFHYSIKNFDNVDNILERNKYLNYTLMNGEKIIKKELSKKNMLSEIKELEYNESNDNDIIEQKTSNIKKGVITEEEKYQKRPNTKPNTHHIDIKKTYQKEIKNKRYYGYDDRHNLEGIINNHSVYVSVYSKKANKIN